jgi:hypothetical protein
VPQFAKSVCALNFPPDIGLRDVRRCDRPRVLFALGDQTEYHGTLDNMGLVGSGRLWCSHGGIS